ncbi:glycosyltransferase family 1 protein [Pantoea stewartii]|uniref:glycosyltransferase family 4 protein n=1 Tax=Pantoea stewartii TaxID=66269 RepID=UPI0023F9C264|nr:glycosyltransferase family 1 protein [Pantoea stewartii]MDF7785636.1 glycosyltransferase family 1 protein [Pantoea stewartii]MEB6533490.1 glycosyltransferase family 4 protein [Pantoea stewartii]
MDAGSQKLDVVFSTDCIKYPLTGIGRYAFELARELQQREEYVKLTYLHGTRITDSLTVASESSQSVQSLKRKLQKNRTVSELYRLTFPMIKSLALRKFKHHIFHSPNYYLPPHVRHCVATFHDLSIFHWPQFHPAGRVHLMQKELRNTVSRASVLITDSHYTKGELIDFFDVASDKIVVAPLAYNKNFHPRSACEVESTLIKYKLKWRQYFLYIGTIEPRKNILTLLKAYDRLSFSSKNNFPLVISGYKGWESDELFKLFTKGESEGWLKYLGFVPGKDLPVLYSAANCFVFPSIYEGFGLPVLEAIASGTPVICSNTTSLPEVVGEAALMHDPEDVDNLTYYIQMMIDDAEKKQLMIDTGLIQAKKFSWSVCADKTIEAYEQVAKFL